MTAPKRRVTAKLKARIQELVISYGTSHRLYEPSGHERMVGERSWTAIVRDPELGADADEIAWIKVHRVPLNNGEDIFVNLDYGMPVPHTPAFAVLGSWDQLKISVLNRLHQDDWDIAVSAGATFLIVETGWIDPAWRDLQVSSLLLCTVLRELRRDSDVIAVSFQLPMFDGDVRLPKAENAAIRAEWRKAYAYAGFTRFQGATMLLADTRLPAQLLPALEEKFGYPSAVPGGPHGPR